jgi:hypothetical protein
LRTLLQVQRSADSGSPRLSGSSIIATALLPDYTNRDISGEDA